MSLLEKIHLAGEHARNKASHATRFEVVVEDVGEERVEDRFDESVSEEENVHKGLGEYHRVKLRRACIHGFL